MMGLGCSHDVHVCAFRVTAEYRVASEARRLDDGPRFILSSPATASRASKPFLARAVLLGWPLLLHELLTSWRISFHHILQVIFSNQPPRMPRIPKIQRYHRLATIPCILQHINQVQPGSRIDIQNPSFINASQKPQHPGLPPQDTISMVNLAEESYSMKLKTDAHGTSIHVFAWPIFGTV
jgi:hypothetical protein